MDKKKNLDISMEIEEITSENELFENTGGKEERLFWAWSKDDDPTDPD